MERFRFGGDRSYAGLHSACEPTDSADYEKLPAKAQHYLEFLEKETGAKIGMISTGPDREQTIFMEDFAAEMSIQPVMAVRRK